MNINKCNVMMLDCILMVLTLLILINVLQSSNGFKNYHSKKSNGNFKKYGVGIQKININITPKPKNDDLQNVMKWANEAVDPQLNYEDQLRAIVTRVQDQLRLKYHEQNFLFSVDFKHSAFTRVVDEDVDYSGQHYEWAKDDKSFSLTRISNCDHPIDKPIIEKYLALVKTYSEMNHIIENVKPLGIKALVALFNTNNGQIGIRVTEYESGCLFEKKIGYNILNIYGKNNSMHTSVPIKKSFRSMLDHLTNSSAHTNDYKYLSNEMKQNLVEFGQGRKLWFVCMGIGFELDKQVSSYKFAQNQWKFGIEVDNFLDKYILIGEVDYENIPKCKSPDKSHLQFIDETIEGFVKDQDYNIPVNQSVINLGNLVKSELEKFNFGPELLIIFHSNDQFAIQTYINHDCEYVKSYYAGRYRKKFHLLLYTTA